VRKKKTCQEQKFQGKKMCQFVTKPPPNSVKCGDVIRQDITLLQDLECNCQRAPGSSAFALTVVGPATLDLNSFSVKCETDEWVGETDGSAIIKVDGILGVIKNGKVSRGNFGIVLGDRGHHTVENVIVESTANDGLQINAPFCEVTSSEFMNNGNGFFPTSTLLAICEGNLIDCEFIEDSCSPLFDPLNPEKVPCFNGNVSGDAIDIGENSRYSVVQGNTISRFGDDGLTCRGDFNVIMGNTISIDEGEESPRITKSEDGITIRGVGNQVIGNTILNTIKNGINVKFTEDADEDDCDQIFTGGFNIIRSNEIKGSVDGKGMKIGSDNNFIVFNSVESTIADAGFNIDKGDCDRGGNRNYMADNMSHNNAEAGFRIEETNNNVVVRNTATGNTEEGFVLEVEEVEDEVRGLANIVAGNIATGNESGRDFREKGDDTLGDCTQNAYIGNMATSSTDADPSCTLGEQIDLSLQDEV